jgi:hypothetical protein
MCQDVTIKPTPEKSPILSIATYSKHLSQNSRPVDSKQIAIFLFNLASII